MIFYFFIDGIGFGEDDETINPFAKYAKGFFLPLAKKSLPKNSKLNSAKYLQTDASMGVKGLPQSATGQTAIWTGIKAPEILNRHVSGYPSFTLRKIINELSCMKVLEERDKKVAFLNAYSPVYFTHMQNKPKLISASTMIQLASKIPLLPLESILEDKGIFMDINHEFLREFAKNFLEPDHALMKIRDPYTVGKNVLSNYKDHDLVLYEYFLTDKMGHEQNWNRLETIIETVEKFIDGVIDSMDESDLLIITSDHGNSEDLSVDTHTKNLVPCFLYGNYDDSFLEIRELSDILPNIYSKLGIDFKPEWEKNPVS